MKSKTKISIVFLALIIVSAQMVSCKKDSSSIENSASAAIVDNAVADSISDTSLIAWYTFDNGDLSDHSGNGNNIVFCNAQTTSGKKGTPRSAYLFNGKGNYMQVPNSTSLNPSSQISFAVLFKPKGFYSVNTTRIFMKGMDDQSDGDYYAGYNSDGTLYGTYGNNQYQSAGVSSPVNSIQLNNWYKLVYTYNGTVAKLYINNKLVSKVTESAVFTPNTFPLRIGKTGRTDFPYYFNGVIDEIRIYNVGLTASQVATVNSELGN